METLEISVEKEYNNSEQEYNKSLLKTVATLYSLHSELLVQLANLSKYNEMYDEFANIPDSNAQDLIELIDLLKTKMNILLNRTLE